MPRKSRQSKATRAERERQHALDAIWEAIRKAGAITDAPRSADSIARVAGLVGRAEGWREDIHSALYGRPGIRKIVELSANAKSSIFYVVKESK